MGQNGNVESHSRTSLVATRPLQGHSRYRSLTFKTDGLLKHRCLYIFTDASAHCFNVHSSLNRHITTDLDCFAAVDQKSYEINKFVSRILSMAGRLVKCQMLTYWACVFLCGIRIPKPPTVNSRISPALFLSCTIISRPPRGVSR